MADDKISKLWWNADPGRATALAVSAEAAAREMNSMPRRWRSYCYFRCMTGRPVSNQFAFAMARRPSNFASYYGQFDFAPMRAGFSGMLGDIYVNRVFNHRTFLQFIPERGDFAQRQAGLDFEDWIDGGFEDLKFWHAYKQMCMNASFYGTGFLEWGALGKDIYVKSKNPDELLFANEDDCFPREVIDRVWASREDTMELYGKNPEAIKAIQNAKSYPAFYFGPGELSCDDVIPLLKAYRVNHVDGTRGRYVYVVDDYCIEDTEYDDTELPFEKFQFHELPDSVYGQGLAELTLQYSDWIDELLAVWQDSDARSGLGKWLIEENSNVNDQALGDTNAAVVKYQGVEPKFVAYEPVGQWTNQRFTMLWEKGMQRVHVSANAIAGDVPKALTSAEALERWTEIDDANYAEMLGRLEEVVKRSAYHMIRLGKKVKPSFTRPGRNRELIDWNTLKINKGGRPVGLKGFNVGRLGQTVAGQVQQLKDMLADGDIDRRLYTKYLQSPDMSQLLDELNAPTESVSRCLDKLVLGDEYIPPSPDMDPDYMVQAVGARILLEQDQDTPEDVLDRLRMWKAAAKALRAQMLTPPAPVGLTPPGAAPGAPVGTAGGIPGAPIPIPGSPAGQAPIPPAPNNPPVPPT